MTFHIGDVVRFRHDPNEPGVRYPGHTGLVLVVQDELGDDANDRFIGVVWSTAGTVGEYAEMDPRYLDIVKHQEQ